MPVTRKQQVLTQTEVSVGSGAPVAYGASHAIQITDPTISDSVETTSRAPSGPTLSRDKATVGRKARQLSFTSELRGSGTVGVAPDFGQLLKACGYKASDLRDIDLSGTSGGTGYGFHLGEQVYQGASYAAATAVGVVVCCLSAAGAVLENADATGERIIVALVSGDFADATNTIGKSSLYENTITSDVAYSDGFGYQVTSRVLVQVDTGAWSGTDPVDVGEILAVERAGKRVGAVQIISDNGSTWVDMMVTNLWGTMLNGDTLRSAGDGTAVIGSAPVQSETTSQAFQHNLDGRNRQLVGARGDVSASGESGAAIEMAWTFDGSAGTDSDALPIVTSGLNSTTAPRLAGAICAYGQGVNTLRLQTKSVQLTAGNSVNPNADANATGGASGSNITDRELSLAVTVDISHSNFDWEAARDNAEELRLAFVLGDTRGNIICITAPKVQATEVSISDAEGIATFDVTLNPYRINESGDDELYICQV